MATDAPQRWITSLGKNQSNQFRVIAGLWRGRRIAFPPLPGIRPTPDRVRETLFNWLAPTIEGARCLDLFAGSGALAFEAISRGAQSVLSVDREKRVVSHLRSQAKILGQSQRMHFQCADALRFLTGPSEAFDLVFLDPPYHAGLLPPVLARLDEAEGGRSGGLVYVEYSKDEGLPTLPAGWAVRKRSIAGQVCFQLLSVDGL